jgi:adenine-specific DNA-methyltransferase
MEPDLMAGKTKLELTWIGKDERPRLEPRILIEEPEFSYHAETRCEGDNFDNSLIQGDNLLALKALETDANVRGKVKCIFIDPPYNTGNDFLHYPDGVEHSMWLSMMRDRLVILRSLLSNSGSIWITIDDNEAHYLKVLCDEIFGRRNFITTVCWEKIYTLKNTAKHFSSMHDFILVYAKDIEHVEINPLERGEKQNASFKNPDNDPRGSWLDSAMHARNYYSKGSYTVLSPSGKEFAPPPGRYWSVSEENFKKLDSDGRVWWGRNGANAPRKKTFLTDVKQGVVPGTIWSYKDAGQNAEAKDEIKKLFAQSGGDIFITPKPERLLRNILTISTNAGDIVLDSFAGTGTTGAVAHKMGRRWIMVELGEHAKTHIVPRMQQVVDGSDKGGVTESANWQGGGGYRFFKLAPSLLQKDKWGNLVINKDYQPEMLAEAICKHFNYTYAPSTEYYWIHGKATENAFIYVTTNSLTFDQLKVLSDEVGEERSLLVCCMAYEAAGDNLTNLTIKKIPRVVLDRCEWGKDDYSLKIAALPLQDVEPEEADAKPNKSKKIKASVAQTSLFDGSEEN